MPQTKRAHKRMTQLREAKRLQQKAEAGSSNKAASLGSAIGPSLAARVDEDHKVLGYSRV